MVFHSEQVLGFSCAQDYTAEAEDFCWTDLLQCIHMIYPLVSKPISLCKEMDYTGFHVASPQPCLRVQCESLITQPSQFYSGQCSPHLAWATSPSFGMIKQLRSPLKNSLVFICLGNKHKLFDAISVIHYASQSIKFDKGPSLSLKYGASN